MFFLPKGKFTWLLIVIAAFIYYKDYSDRQSAHKIAKNKVQENKVQEQTSEATKETTAPEKPKPAEPFEDRIVNKIKENDTAKVLLDALVKKSVEDQYGKKEIREIAALTTGSLVVIDVLKGGGAELRCGGEAVIKYDAYMSNGLIFDSTNSKVTNSQFTFQTGKNQVIKGLEAGIIGMKEGGKRKISIPPGLGFNVPGFENTMLPKDEVISYDVELVSIKDGIYKNTAALNVKSDNGGSGKKILCGDKVKVKYSLRDAGDAKLSNVDGSAEFIVGSGNVPIGFELAVSDMKIGGKKKIVIPHDLLKILGKSVLASEIKVTAGKSLQAEIEVLE